MHGFRSTYHTDIENMKERWGDSYVLDLIERRGRWVAGFWYLWESGARLHVEEPINFPPPKDPRELYEAQKQFYWVKAKRWKLKYEEVREKYHSEIEQAERTAGQITFDVGQAKKHLKLLKWNMEKSQQTYDDFTREERERRDASYESTQAFQASLRHAAAAARQELEEV